MWNRNSFISFILTSLFLTTAFSATRVEQLNQVFANYNKRFTTGAYVKNSNLANEFTSSQETFVAQMKSIGALKQILVINNDYDNSLIIKLYLLTDEQNSILGFYHEKSSYASNEERSFLRFRLPSVFEQGVGFIRLDSGYALTVKGFYFKPDTSATIQFVYLTDLIKSSVGVLNLFLLKKNEAWGFYTEQYQPVQSAFVKAWTSLFPPSGGISSVVLN